MTAAHGAPLRFMNTLGREQQEFQPLHPGRVGMYTCGPTVYYYAHLGNLRAYVFADVLKRTLRWKGHDVRHVMNITDVGHLTSDADEGDDKVALAARREGRTIWEIADHYTEAFVRDTDALRIIRPDVSPRATDHVEKMIEFAKVLESNGCTYTLPSGLYFDTADVANYGELALLDVEGLRAGARVETVDGKRNKTDFAIWRTAAPDQRRLMEWDSPWGAGAPGWHLECSVMSMEYLGEHFDIHTGGVDHIAVHHVNEIAQSEAYLADGRPWVPYWMHNEFIVFGDEKMSKSKGGTVRLDELVAAGIHPLSYRYFTLGAQYRTQLDFSIELVRSAQNGLRRILARVGGSLDEQRPAPTFAATRSRLTTEAGLAYLEAFDDAISNDLNTSVCLATLAAITRDDDLHATDRHHLLDAIDGVLGVGLDLTEADLSVSVASASEASAIDDLVAQRDRARAEGRWADADALRDELLTIGVEVRDSSSGTTWRYLS